MATDAECLPLRIVPKHFHVALVRYDVIHAVSRLDDAVTFTLGTQRVLGQEQL
jgi:hypothetical protein